MCLAFQLESNLALALQGFLSDVEGAEASMSKFRVGGELSESTEGSRQVFLARAGAQGRSRSSGTCVPGRGATRAPGAMLAQAGGSVWHSSTFQTSPVMTGTGYANTDLQHTGGAACCAQSEVTGKDPHNPVKARSQGVRD